MAIKRHFRRLAAMWRIWLPAAGILTLAGCAATGPPSAYEASSGRSAEASRSMVETRYGLGTGWGEDRHSSVSNTTFARATSAPAAQTSIYYNDREGLLAMAPAQVGRGFVRRKFDVGSLATVEIRPGGSFRGAEGYRINGRNYVVGKDGQRYSIKITNRTHQRIEVVLSVDGLDVLDGRSASTRKPGYAIGPRGSVTVDGWRKDMSHVAAFRFGSVADSYASRSGAGTKNVGVIGVAVFEEKHSHYHHPHPIILDHPHWRGDSHVRHAAEPFPAEGRFAKPPRD